MFGIDFSEVLVIFVIALVVLGPEKLPRVAQNVGRWIGRARGMARQFRDQLEQEAETLRRDVDPQIHNPLTQPVTAEQLMPDPVDPAGSPQPPDSSAEPGSSAGPDPAHLAAQPRPAAAASASAAAQAHEPGA